jgi:hypothetical protein
MIIEKVKKETSGPPYLRGKSPLRISFSARVLTVS